MAAKFIQVGTTSVRDPITGNFIQSTPLYIKAVKGAEEAEQDLIDDLGSIFAFQMRDYLTGCQEAGIEV